MNDWRKKKKKQINVVLGTRKRLSSITGRWNIDVKQTRWNRFRSFRKAVEENGENKIDGDEDGQRSVGFSKGEEV